MEPGGLQHACYNPLCDYIKNEDVVAWFSYDEPAPYQWGDAFYSQGKDIRSTIDKYWNQLTLAYGITSSLDLNRISMFNLAAESNSSWAGSFGIPDAEYRKATMTEKLKAARAYLDNLQTLFNPWIWSYDYYPIRNILNKVDSEKDKYEAIEGEYVVEYEHFFGYLGLYQDFTQTKNSDFWAYGMCMSHKLYNNRNWDVLTCSYPTPTEGCLLYTSDAADEL